ncbi:MAG: sensor histidine kinase [Alphaproteobacteria bacterium]|nr:sensor histidine kinase [Alphaproteobacteria bacterium]
MNQIRKDKGFFAHIGIGFSIIILLLVAFYVYLYDQRLQEDDLNKGKQDAQRIAVLMRNQLELSIMTSDQLLSSAIDRQYVNMLFGGTLGKDLEEYFRSWLKEYPHYRAMFITDESGEVKLMILSQGRKLPSDVTLNFYQHAFFSHHQNQDDENPFATTITKDGLFKAQDLILSRRMNKVDGQFGGVVGVVIDHDYFAKLSELLGNYTHSDFWILDADNNVLLKKASTNISQELLRKIDALHNNSRDRHDIINVRMLPVKKSGITDIVATTGISKLPLHIIVRLGYQDIFKDIGLNYHYSGTLLIVFFLFTLTISILLFKLSLQMKKVRKSQHSAVLASQAKSDFLAKMSHELRTPLNAIIGFSQMLAEGYFGLMSDKQLERVKDINMCGDHLLQLINDILEFSKGEAGKVILQEDTVNVPEVIEQVLRMMDQRAKNAKITIIDDIPHHLPLLKGDERKIKQILINLLTNAIKFTKSGGWVTIKAKIDMDSNYVVIVSDNGVGIDPADIPKALSAFEQVGSDMFHQEGTGLGLSLCKMFTELHGGTMQIESARNEGTTISIIFPAERVYRFEEGLSLFSQERLEESALW